MVDDSKFLDSNVGIVVIDNFRERTDVFLFEHTVADDLLDLLSGWVRGMG